MPIRPRPATCEKRVGDTTVVLEEAKRESPSEPGDKPCWRIRLRLQFDKPGEALQSHRVGWLELVQVYLEGPDGKPIAFDASESTGRTENEVGTEYVFSLDQLPANYSLVCRVPAAIISRSFDYVITDVPLP